MSEASVIVVAAEHVCGFDGEIGALFGRCPCFLVEANGTTATTGGVTTACAPWCPD